MHLKASYLIIITLLFSACSSDEGGINPISNLEPIKQFDTDIIGISDNVNEDYKNDVQLELAFGKLLAHAMTNNSLKEYLKNEMDNPEHCFFKELLLAEHIDVEISDGLTLRTMIEEIQDDEVNALFESDLIELLLTNRPMLSLKFPDKVKTLEWDVNEITPPVYVRSKARFIDTTFLSYRIYGANGYSEDVFWKSELEYFSVVSGYSQHYILCNENDWTNELGVPLTMQFPELKVDWEYYEPKLKALSRTHPFYNGIILDKYEVYYLIDDYYNQEQFDKSLVDQSGCNDPSCPSINCYDIDTLNTLFSDIQISGPGRIFALGNTDLFENIGFYFKSIKADKKESTNELFYELTTNGRKYCEVFPTFENINISTITNEIHDISIPVISFDNATILESKRLLEINRHLLSGWPFEGDTFSEIISNGTIYSRSDHIIFDALVRELNYDILNTEISDIIIATQMTGNSDGFEIELCGKEKSCYAFDFQYCTQY